MSDVVVLVIGQLHFNLCISLFFSDVDELSEITLLVAALLLQKSGKNGLSSFIQFIPVSFFLNIFY